MRFDWENDYPYHEVKANIQAYLDEWDKFNNTGMGIEIYSPSLGTGKTATAAHVGKTLIKRGVKVQFAQFSKLIDRLLANDAEYAERLRTATLLIIDDILPAVSVPQALLFGTKLEEIVRERTNWDLPIITTSNLTPDEIGENYPRIYSLLAPKQLQIQMPGGDARLDVVRKSNEEKAINGERSPIT